MSLVNKDNNFEEYMRNEGGEGRKVETCERGHAIYYLQEHTGKCSRCVMEDRKAAEKRGK